MNIQDKYGDSDDENSINSESDNESEDSIKDDYDDDYDEEVEVEKYGGGDKENDDEEYEDNGVEDVENIDINLNVDDDEDDEDDEKYLQKFNNEVNRNYLIDYHPECIIHNYDEIMSMTKVVRDKNNNIIDDLHKTLPYLTKYEKARILGQRAKQINSKAKVFVKVPDNVIDGYLIAQLELKEKRIPFIIRRPLPSGGCEYWSLKDLEIIDF
jgi:DNA-directed RNA polymerase I, II, and III subunit RPABC2